MNATPEQLRRHYELETRLARRILESTPEERAAVTRACYDEMYRVVTWHDYATPDEADERYRRRVGGLFSALVGSGRRVLDIGCGLGDRAARIAAAGNQCVGMDISAEILTRARAMHPGMPFTVGDAVTLDGIEAASYDVVLTSQLVEHLHPDDVPLHLASVARVLRPGGVYIFDTPHRLLGPSDISGLFGDKVATGFHLKEWTYRELAQLLESAGFVGVRTPWGPPRLILQRPALARRLMAPVGWKLPVESLAMAAGSRGFARLLNRIVRFTILVEARRGA